MLCLLRYRTRRVLSLFAAGMTAAVCAAPAAQAAQDIVLISGQSMIVSLPEAPATVLIGNPSVADITTDGRSMFFHPRGYGLTNIVALDAKGRKLGDYMVRVIFEDSLSVSVYSPSGRQTYTCRRDCEPTLRIGDSDSFLGRYAGQVSTATSLATSQPTGDDATGQPVVTQQMGMPQTTEQPSVISPTEAQPAITVAPAPAGALVP